MSDNEKGIIYIMTTAVSGLIKIGKTGTKNYAERMRNLEGNGYYNVAGLKKFFAIELEEYEGKEKLLLEIFNKHRVGESELFALDQDLLRSLLLSFKGSVVFPEIRDQEKEFEKVSKAREESNRFSFYKKGLKKGDVITFIKDKNITATVAGERTVEYGGEILKLAPLTYKLYEQRGELYPSGAYRGSAHFEFNGKKLKDLSDIDFESL